MSHVLPVKSTARHSIWIKSEKHADLRVLHSFWEILGASVEVSLDNGFPE